MIESLEYTNPKTAPVPHTMSLTATHSPLPPHIKPKVGHKYFQGIYWRYNANQRLGPVLFEYEDKDMKKVMFVMTREAVDYMFDTYDMLPVI
tara:strand:+ start:490 stop:765 length:276 start_codon:yes stop_codon:yes gene_type:complete